MRRAAPMMVIVKVVIIALALVSCTSAQCEGAKCVGSRVDVTLGAGSQGRTFEAEIAADPVARARGLMGRSEIRPRTGMLFLFPQPTNGGFWMKDTLVGLDIAFIAEGHVLEVRTMTPCSADPCPLTKPSGPYTSALETAAGALDGIEPGAPVAVTGHVPAAS